MTLELMDLVIARAEIEEGVSIRNIAVNSLVHLNGVQSKHRGSRSYPQWTEAEDQYLKDHLGRITEEEIARHLGRTIVGVHLRWKRDLHLTAPSKDPEIITGQKAANMLGIDGHKIMHWCDMGMIKARRMRGTREGQERVIRLINRVSFFRWVVNTDNWIYFNWKEIPDAHLRRLCELKAERWDDEWWTTVQVARYHKVTSKDVHRLLTIKKTLAGVRASTSIGGRHKDPYWLNWFVKRSDALEVEFIRGSGNGTEARFTVRAEAWMVKAYKMGWSYEAINRSMGCKVTSWTLSKRIGKLLKQDAI